MITLTFTAENSSALLKDVTEMFNAEDPIRTPEKGKPAKVAKKTTSEAGNDTTPAAAVSTPPAAPPAAVGPVTLDDVKAIIPKVLAHAGKDKLVALLEQYGAKRGSEIPAAKYAEFVGNANALLS